MSQHPRKPPMSSNATYSQQTGQGRNVGNDAQKQQPRRPPMRGQSGPQGGNLQQNVQNVQGGVQAQRQPVVPGPNSNINNNNNNNNNVQQQAQQVVQGVTGAGVQQQAQTNVYSAQVNTAPQNIIQNQAQNSNVQAAQQVQTAQGSQATIPQAQQPIYLMAQHPGGVMLGNYPVQQVIFQPQQGQLGDQSGAQQARPQRAPMRMQVVNMPMNASGQQGQPIFVVPQQAVAQAQAQVTDGNQGATTQQSGQTQATIVQPTQQAVVTQQAVQQTNQQNQQQNQTQVSPQQNQQQRQSKPPQTSGASPTNQVNGQSGVPTKGGTNDAPQQSPKKLSSPGKPGQRRAVAKGKAGVTAYFEFTGTGKERPQEQGWAERVRQVISGDTLKLALPKKPSDRYSAATLQTIILDGIRTPKLQRWSGAEEDAFGFAARECVRKLVLNKRVYYCVWKIQTKEDMPTRYFGDVYVNDKDNKRVSVTQYVIANGYGSVVEPKPNNMTQQEHDALLDLQKKAQNAKKGMWVADAQPTKDNNNTTSSSSSKKGKDKNKDKDSNNNNNNNNNNNKNNNNSALDKYKRNLIWVNQSQREFYANKYLNKPLTAIVDSVLSGSTLRVELMPNDTPMTHILMHVNLAGCRAPRMGRIIPQQTRGGSGGGNSAKNSPGKGEKGKKGKKGETSSPGRGGSGNKGGNKNQKGGNRGGQNQTSDEPFAKMAREWTEERLLGQNVTVTMTQIDLQGNIYAQVVHPMGRIAVSLLRQGLAEFEPWTAPKSKQERDLLENAQKHAQQQRDSNGNSLRIWKTKNSSSSVSGALTGQVVQVVSGDTLIVRTEKNQREERFTLSSIYAPRLGTRGRQQQQNQNRNGDERKLDEDQPFAREAKEFLRKKTIGQQVSVIVEYSRDPSQNAFNRERNNINNNNNKGGNKGGDNNNNAPRYPKQTFATIYVGSPTNGINIAEELVKKGLARAVPHPVGQKKKL